MKKYAQLMVHFPWFRSPWWLVKKGGSFLNRGKQEIEKYCNEAITRKPLQQSRCKEAIAKWRYFSSSSTLPYLYLVKIQTI